MSTVYLIRAVSTPRYKIGFTTGNPLKRLTELQTGSPYLLELLDTRIGPMSEESKLHRMFRHHRRQGEWFEFASDEEAIDCFHARITRTRAEKDAIAEQRLALKAERLAGRIMREVYLGLGWTAKMLSSHSFEPQYGDIYYAAASAALQTGKRPNILGIQRCLIHAKNGKLDLSGGIDSLIM